MNNYVVLKAVDMPEVGVEYLVFFKDEEQPEMPALSTDRGMIQENGNVFLYNCCMEIGRAQVLSFCEVPDTFGHARGKPIKVEHIYQDCCLDDTVVTVGDMRLTYTETVTEVNNGDDQDVTQ